MSRHLRESLRMGAESRTQSEKLGSICFRRVRGNSIHSRLDSEWLQTLMVRYTNSAQQWFCDSCSIRFVEKE